MIPATLGAFVAFLGLVAPGLVYELLSERRRPLREQTAFREASRIALTSLVFSVASFLLTYITGRIFGNLSINWTEWLDQGVNYFKANDVRVVGNFLVQVSLACGLAALTEWYFGRRSKVRLVGGSLWFEQFRNRRPPGTTPWVHVKLIDADEIQGYLGDYTASEKLENRELTVVGPKLRIKTLGAATFTELDKWASITVRGERIDWLKVTYVEDQSGDVIHTRAPLTG
jgi:hypothetical protein